MNPRSSASPEYFAVLLPQFILLLLIVWHEYTLAIGTVVYAFYGFALWVMGRIRRAKPVV